MRYGISVPNFGSFADVRKIAEMAHDAERAGWDGFFVWDHISSAASYDDKTPIADPWIMLTAIALATERIRIGTLITPLPRRRPWKLARETVTLDHLSGGRFVLGAGLGFPPEEYNLFGEDADERTRGRKLDEALDVLTGLWSAKPFRFDGEHYTVRQTTFSPPPLQSARIPVWVAGMWPSRPPFRRAAKWDGVVPIHADITPLSVDELRQIVAYVRAHRTSSAPFDVVIGGESSGQGPFVWKTPIREYEAAGATWWNESLTDWRGQYEDLGEVIRRGPPRA